MARSIIFVVSDDVEVVQKAKQFSHLNGLKVQTYSTSDWQHGLRKPGFLEQLSENVPALSTGATESGGKILPFPGTSGSNTGGRKVATINELEAVAIENAIHEFNGNLTEAAKGLGIGRATLYRKVKQYQIDPSEARRQKKAA